MNKVREKNIHEFSQVRTIKILIVFLPLAWVKPEYKATPYFIVFKHSFSKFRVVKKDC